MASDHLIGSVAQNDHLVRVLGKQLYRTAQATFCRFG